MQYTQQQLNVLETVSQSGSFAFRARAGSSKTTMLQAWSNACKKSGSAISFSDSTTKELLKKLSSRFPAKTFHTTGLAALKGNAKSITLDKSKIFSIVKTLAEENDIPFELQSEIRSLAIMAKTYGIQPDFAGPEGLTPNEPIVWEELANTYDIEFSDEILHWAINTVNLSNQAFKKDGIIDFDDMLYCAIIYPHRFTRQNIILADEVQDFNTLQHTMLRRCLLPGGRIIAAGDDRQAIYGFRGALSNSYQDLVDTFSMQERPLTISFRCPKEVILCAQQYVPDIEAAPSNIQGAVLYPFSLSLSEIPKTVLCRNNAPLMRLALALLGRGRTVEIAGRDLGQNLIKLTKRITKKNLSTPEFLDRLTRWKEKEIARYPRRKNSVIEKAQVLGALASAHTDLEGMQKHLEKLYPNANSKDYRPADVHLSTIHRAKGREWPNVLFLDSYLIGKHAEQKWEIIQEENLAYVGITRAQRELTFITSKQIEELDNE